MVVVYGMSYERLAEATACAIGTAKSRVFRARRQLETWLLGEEERSSALRFRGARIDQKSGARNSPTGSTRLLERPHVSALARRRPA